MDQKIQGGTATPPPLPTALPAGERDKDGGGGKKDEEEEKKKREREKEGTRLTPLIQPEVATGEEELPGPLAAVVLTSPTSPSRRAASLRATSSSRSACRLSA